MPSVVSGLSPLPPSGALRALPHSDIQFTNHIFCLHNGFAYTIVGFERSRVYAAVCMHGRCYAIIDLCQYYSIFY